MPRSVFITSYLIAIPWVEAFVIRGCFLLVGMLQVHILRINRWNRVSVYSAYNFLFCFDPYYLQNQLKWKTRREHKEIGRAKKARLASTTATLQLVKSRDCKHVDERERDRDRNRKNKISFIYIRSAVGADTLCFKKKKIIHFLCKQRATEYSAVETHASRLLEYISSSPVQETRQKKNKWQERIKGRINSQYVYIYCTLLACAHGIHAWIVQIIHLEMSDDDTNVSICKLSL